MSDSFKTLFGKEAEADAFAPGRVNLIGEYTDLVGGSVLPMPLTKGITIEVAHSDGTNLAFSCQQQEQVELNLAASAKATWTDYVVGPLLMMRRAGLRVPDLNIRIDADLPAGAGVSSSAALEVAIIRTVLALTGEKLAPVEIARLARQAENEYCGVPCGIMDQMAVAVGERGKALSLDCGKLSYRNLTIPKDWCIAVVHCGQARQLVDGAYAERRDAILEAESILGGSLKHASPEMLSKISEPIVQKRARHVITEMARVAQAVEALESGDRNAFGTLMNESHQSLQTDFDVSTPGLDVLVDAARAAGAHGARLTGAGFGGCIVALIDAPNKERWWQRVSGVCPAAWLVSL